jgi:photosystem II stability/assembly factor-like uncharacterized protein
MPVITPPRQSEVEQDRDLEQRVADLEALIEEARRRARRRRVRNGAAFVVAAAAGVAGLIGFNGNGGGDNSTASLAHRAGSHGAAGKSEAPPLAALPVRSGFVDSFAFDLRDPQVVYVLTAPPGRLLKTTDGGAHWQATSARAFQGANEALAVDLQHPGVLYVGTSAAVYKTVDGGRSWRSSNRGLLAPPTDPPDFTNEAKGRVTALAVDPANTNTVYAGSDHISKSNDGGNTWKTVFPPHPREYRDSVSALAIAPTRPEAIYAIIADSVTGQTSVDESTDGGTAWHTTTVVSGLQGGGVGWATALAIDPRHPATVYAALGANLLKTTDAGKTWRRIGHGLPIAANLPRPGCHCRDGVTTLAIDPHRTSTVYVALQQGGIYKTADGGRTWLAIMSTPLYIATVAIDPARPATIYSAGEHLTQTGNPLLLLRSRDSGHTWTTAG